MFSVTRRSESVLTKFAVMRAMMLQQPAAAARWRRSHLLCRATKRGCRHAHLTACDKMLNTSICCTWGLLITQDTSCMLSMFLSPVLVVTHTGTKSKWEAEHPRTLQECNKTALDSYQLVDSMLHAECTRLTDWLASASYKSSTARLMEGMSSWW